MSITTEVFVLLFVLLSPEGFLDSGVAFTGSMDECGKVASIIVNDFKILDETESTMKKEDIVPRFKLMTIECVAAEAPLSGMKTKHLESQVW